MLRIPPRRGRPQAFTLAELLVVVAMGTVVLAGAVMMLVSHIRSSSRMAALLHLQDHCGWVQFLINREIEQAERATDGGSVLGLVVPGFSVPVTITYRLEGNVLTREGPGIDAQGRLLVPQQGYQPRTDVVARQVDSFVVDVASNPRSPRYALTLRDASGVTSTIDQDDGDAGGAYCRARDISRTAP